MGKVIRLTENDLARIVKRVVKENYRKRIINEILGSPLNAFYSEMEQRGYVLLWGDETKIFNDSNAEILYVGKLQTNDWKFVTMKDLEKPEFEHGDVLLDWNSKKWKKVKSPSMIQTLNREAERNSWDVYEKLKNEPTVENIVYVLERSKNFFNDNEAYAEAAFMAIDSIQKYKQVASSLGEDPYKFVKSFMDTSKVYHKKSIDSSMQRLKSNKELF